MQSSLNLTHLIFKTANICHKVKAKLKEIHFLIYNFLILGYNKTMFNVLVAPTAVASNSEKYAKRIVSYLKSQKTEFSVFFSNNINEFEDNTSSLVSQGQTEFIVVGNDFALHSFINSVHDLSKIKFGIIPTSKNDSFARYIGLETNPIHAIKDIFLNETDSIDYLVLNDFKVLNNITIGASTELDDIYEQTKVKNLFTKKFQFFKFGNKFDGITLNMANKSGKIKTEDVFELSIANGGFSKSKNLSPLSNVRDGLFNFNYCTMPERRTMKKYLGMYKKGKQIHDENTHQHWLNELHITNENRNVKATVDGKVMTLDELNVYIVEGGLKILKSTKNLK